MNMNTLTPPPWISGIGHKATGNNARRRAGGGAGHNGAGADRAARMRRGKSS